jgi:NtrC-family two-component system response regulator AlgB
MARLLIVDDGKNIRRHLATFFERQGHEVQTAESAAEALSLQTRGEGFDLILTDYRMGEMNGLELLQELKARQQNVAVILMTAYATVANAVAAIKAGAHDYVTKPFSLEQLSHVIERALELQKLRSENRALRDTVEKRPFLDSENSQMRRLFRSAQQFASADVPVLLIGESGTGKRVLARQIHRWSSRRDQPFVVADCESQPQEMLERELFGSVREGPDGQLREVPGRLQAANSGTILLEDIDGLNLALQRRILHFVKHSSFELSGGSATIPVDARIIASSASDLASLVAEKRFREDLFHRLNVTSLCIPPLRERVEDILPLAEHFLSAAALRNNHHQRLSLSRDAAARLTRYKWPGNVRELRNVIERAAILASRDVVTPDHLPDALLQSTSAEDLSEEPLATTMNDLEREHIVRVLASSDSLEKAAEKLGINAATLWRKRKRYGIN